MRQVIRIVLSSLALSIVMVMAAGCAGRPVAAEEKLVTGSSMNVTLESYHISISTNKLRAGQVTFTAQNAAPLTHEMLVVPLDGRTIATLPYDKTINRLSEETLGSLDEIADIAGGTGGTLTMDLKPGRYVLLCNLPLHFQAGMVAPFTVE